MAAAASFWCCSKSDPAPRGVRRGSTTAMPSSAPRRPAWLRLHRCTTTTRSSSTALNLPRACRAPSKPSTFLRETGEVAVRGHAARSPERRFVDRESRRKRAGLHGATASSVAAEMIPPLLETRPADALAPRSGYAQPEEAAVGPSARMHPPPPPRRSHPSACAAAAQPPDRRRRPTPSTPSVDAASIADGARRRRRRRRPSRRDARRVAPPRAAATPAQNPPTRERRARRRRRRHPPLPPPLPPTTAARRIRPPSPSQLARRPPRRRLRRHGKSRRAVGRRAARAAVGRSARPKARGAARSRSESWSVAALRAACAAHALHSRSTAVASARRLEGTRVWPPKCALLRRSGVAGAAASWRRTRGQERRVGSRRAD